VTIEELQATLFPARDRVNAARRAGNRARAEQEAARSMFDDATVVAMNASVEEDQATAALVELVLGLED